LNSDTWESNFGTNGKSDEDFGSIKVKNEFNIVTQKLHWKMIDGRFTAEDEKLSN